MLLQLVERYFASETSLFATQRLSRIDQRVAEYATYFRRFYRRLTARLRPESGTMRSFF